MFDTIGQIVAAYFVADLVAAVYHYATDSGWNTPRIVSQFINHHQRPETMTFDLEPMLGGLPLIVVGVWCSSLFVVAFGCFISLAQIPHYYTHHAAPSFVVALQQWGLILSPDAHERHHNSTAFDRNFSVINGWSNPLLNWCLGKLAR